MASLVPPHAHGHIRSNYITAGNPSDSGAGAQSLQIVTLAIPNPEWHGFGPADVAHRLTSNISFTYLISFNISTLAMNGASGGSDVTGLLYVPDIPLGDPCVNITAPYVPSNVTRQSNLPSTDYELIGVAPWVTANCSLAFMDAARQDPARGLLFFLPGNSTDMPPDASNETWATPDDHWKTQNGFPVYAIDSQSGALLMRYSALYSGNMTEVPYGHELTELGYDPRDYIRLYVDIDIGSPSSVPSLWVFLLVVLGILLAIIGLTSFAMHWLQRRRRQALRRRVISGDVDLEALGIKRLTVPQELLNQMPLYTYGTGTPVTRVKQEAVTVEEAKVDGPAPLQPALTEAFAPVLRGTASYRPTPLSQPTCAICLDDFVPATSGIEGTTVRELPCYHIFHPECVDAFLRDSSSLCPMCKKTALPRGYCPRVITNAMVRRERMMRQIRERVDAEPSDNGMPMSFGDRIRTRTMSGFSQLRSGRRITSAPIPHSQPMEQMGSHVSSGTALANPPLHRLNSTTSESIQPVRSQVQPSSHPSRIEWARQRAVTMLGQRAPVDPEDEEEELHTPTWRKAVRGVFPGIRR